MGLLTGKTALVTGAGGGLGRAHALLLAEEGAAVVVNDLGGNPDGTGKGTSMADHVVDEIKEAGGEAVADYNSVTDPKGAEAMVQKAVDAFEHLDICINNAGILRDKSFKNMTEEMWDIVLDVHLKGTYNVTKAAYAQMLKQGTGGRIIMTSSTSGLLGNFGQTNYGAAKAGIAGFMRCLAPEAIKKKITVNVLAPAAQTRLTENLMGPMGKELTPEKVSPAIVWLCSDEADNVNGCQFLIAGNNVMLLEPNLLPVARKPHDQAPWGVSEIGEHIKEAVKKRKPASAMQIMM